MHKQSAMLLSQKSLDSAAESSKQIKTNKLIQKLVDSQAINPRTGSRSLSRSSAYDGIPEQEKRELLGRREKLFLNKPTDANFGELLMKAEPNFSEQLELLKLQNHSLKVPPAVITHYDNQLIQQQQQNPSFYLNAHSSVLDNIKAAGNFTEHLRSDFGLNQKYLAKILKYRENQQAIKEQQYGHPSIERYLTPKAAHSKRSGSAGLTLKQRNELFLNHSHRSCDTDFLQRCLTGTSNISVKQQTKESAIKLK